MTKSFEVSIAILLLLSFVFFVYEIYTYEYKNYEFPEYINSLILVNAKDQNFRTLVNNKDVDHIYELLYKDIEQKYTIKICDALQDNCVVRTDNLRKTKEIAYTFLDLNKTIYILLY